MLRVARDVPPEAVRQSASHVLFVEGSGAKALDPIVLQDLVGRLVRVQPMGPSFHIASAAQALCQYHPNYYFLIDRDHVDEKTVEESWARFPDPNKDNLLIWRKRELENYFIVPEYLGRSEFLCVPQAELAQKVLTICRKRLYLDVVNLVIIRVREDLKQNWVGLFRSASGFRTREGALQTLLALPAIPNRKRETSRALSIKSLKEMFISILAEFTDGTDKLEYGVGRWLDMVRGKDVFQSLAGNCFRVDDAQGKALQGPQKCAQIARSLMRLPMDRQPSDFRELHALLERRVTETTP